MKQLLLILTLLIFIGCSVEYVLTEDEAFFSDAKSMYEESKYSEAITLFTKIITDCPWSSRVDDSWYYQGLSKLGLAEVNEELVAPEFVPEAISSFQTVPENSNHFVDAIFEIGYSYYLLQNYDNTLIYCQKIILEYPKSTKADNATIYIGHYYRKTNNTDSSIVWYEKVISNFENSTSYDNALYWAGDYYYDNISIDSNREKAIEYLSLFCDISDKTDDKYSKAVTKLKNMGVEL